jgi:hypothetical protein
MEATSKFKRPFLTSWQATRRERSFSKDLIRPFTARWSPLPQKLKKKRPRRRTLRIPEVTLSSRRCFSLRRMRKSWIRSWSSFRIVWKGTTSNYRTTYASKPIPGTPIIWSSSWLTFWKPITTRTDASRCTIIWSSVSTLWMSWFRVRA